jgi:hypothetical protein
VLIAPINTKQWDTRGLLQEYKGPVHCERPFHFLKDLLFIDTLFVKKSERVEALGVCAVNGVFIVQSDETARAPQHRHHSFTHPAGHEIVRHLHSVQVIPLPSGAPPGARKPPPGGARGGVW